MRLIAPKPAGKKSTDAPVTAKEKAQRPVDALAALTVTEAEDRLVPTGMSGYAIRPSSRRSIAPLPRGPTGLLAPQCCRQGSSSTRCGTYASLCAEGGIEVRRVAEYMGHASPRRTETVYTRLF